MQTVISVPSTYCSDDLATLIKALPHAKNLWIVNNDNLREIDLGALGPISSVYIKGCQNLASVATSSVSTVTMLELKKLPIGSVPLKLLPSLEMLAVEDCSIENIDVAECSNLQGIYLKGTHVKELMFCQLSKLNRVTVTDNKFLHTVELRDLPALSSVSISGNYIQHLVLHALSLLDFDCSFNPLSTLRLPNCEHLAKLTCDGCELELLDVSAFPMLQVLSCSDNAIQNLDLRSVPKLASLTCSGTELATLDLTGNTSLAVARVSGNKLRDIKFPAACPLRYLDCSRNCLSDLDTALLGALTVLKCAKNGLTGLNLSKCVELTTLDCSCNRLRHLDLSTCTKLGVAKVDENELSLLNAQPLGQLRTLSCARNNITEMSTPKLLQSLNCSYNALSHVNLEDRVKLESIDCETEKPLQVQITNCVSLKSKTINSLVTYTV